MNAETARWRRHLRFFGPDVQSDVDDELRFHIETKVDELRQDGWPHDRARAEALRQFGDLGQYRSMCECIGKEQIRKMNRAVYLSGWGQDLAYALRQLRKSVGFAATAAFMLALGIGAATSIFDVIYTVVLRPLPFPEPDRIVTVWTTREGSDDFVIPRNFDAWRRETRSFEKMAALERQGFTLTGGAEPCEIAGARVSVNFFDVFAATPKMGRSFSADEDQPGGPLVAVLSDRLWKQHFASDPGVLGRQIHLSRVPYTVIGIMPASFDLRPEAEQIWVPLALGPQEMNWAGGVLYVFGRLRSHVELRQAQAEMNRMARNLAKRYPEVNQGRGTRVGSFAQDLVGDYRQRLVVLLGSVLLVLFIACANVANLLLARGTARAKELAIRSALGASGRRLFRQLLTESALLAMCSVFVGTVLAAVGIRVVQAMSPSSVPRIQDVSLDAPTLLFAIVLGLGTTLTFGALPAWRTLQIDLQTGLKQSGRSEGSVRDWVRSSYIAAEVGLALVLLTGAGLLIRSSIAAQREKPGFATEDLLTVKTTLPRAQYPDAPSVVGAYERLLQQLAAAPGVISVSLSSKVPLGPGTMGLTLKPTSISSGALKSDVSVDLRYISSGYLATLGMPLRAGREFTEGDRAGSRQVVLVNETLSGRLWPAADSVGKSVRIPELNSENPVWEVVGVAGDVRENGLMQPAPPVLFVPFRQVGVHPWQWTQQSLYLVAKTRMTPLSLASQLRQAVRRVDPQLPLGDLQSMDQRFTASLSAARLYGLLLTCLGLTGLLLIAGGIYSVVAFFVTRQRSEIALRVALGASPRQVMTLVITQGMKPVAVGLLVGALLALGFSRVLASQLYSVTASDPATLTIVTVVLALVAALACFLPALRTVRIEPMAALRNE